MFIFRATVNAVSCLVVPSFICIDVLFSCALKLNDDDDDDDLQRSLNKLQHWADSNGFKFSSTKTICVHFCRLRKAHPDPQLLLSGTPIPVDEQTKFLGLVFDKKLSFIPHLQYLKNKCLKALNLLRVVANTKWGSDEKTLLHLYCSLVRSKLEYGAVVYGSARKSYLRVMDPI